MANTGQGLPRKILDETIRDRLIQAIKLGAFIEHACIYAGINSSTFRLWRKHAQSGLEPYKSFWEEVQQAESESIVRRIARIEKAGLDGSWQADAWILERKYPDKFGKRDHLKVEADPNAPVEVELQWADGNVLDREKEIIIDNSMEEE